ARPDRPGDAGLGEIGEQLPRPGEGTHLRHLARVGLGMDAADLRRLFRLQVASGLAEQRVHEQAAAHADAAVDAPHGELDAHALERLAPGEHVLVHAVDERAVEVEQERRARGHCLVLRLGVTFLLDASFHFSSMSCGLASPVDRCSKSTSNFGSRVMPLTPTSMSRTRYGTLPSRFESSELLTYRRLLSGVSFIICAWGKATVLTSFGCNGSAMSYCCTAPPPNRDTNRNLLS